MSKFGKEAPHTGEVWIYRKIYLIDQSWMPVSARDWLQFGTKVIIYDIRPLDTEATIVDVVALNGTHHDVTLDWLLDNYSRDPESIRG